MRARVMYEFAGKMQACYCDANPTCAKTDKAEVWERFIIAAAWLHKATGEATVMKVRVRSPVRTSAHSCTLVKRAHLVQRSRFADWMQQPRILDWLRSVQSCCRRVELHTCRRRQCGQANRSPGTVVGQQLDASLL